eukprot:m.5933 g.5933  ORF g.5933 m.5933 type:complete len:386 (-) comp2565_c0_seq1:183-1340(-)
MNSFPDVEDDEQVLELLQYAQSRIEGPADFAERQAAVLKKGQAGDVLSALAAHAPALMTGPDETEYIFNAMARLVHTLVADKDRAAATRSIAAALGSPSTKGHELSRMKALANLFNSFPASSPSRYDIYLQVVELAATSKNSAVVAGQLKNVDAWLDQWKADAQQRQVLYKKIADLLQAADNRTEHQRFLVKYLQTFNGANETKLREARDDATALVVRALADDSTFDVSDIVALDAVRELKTTKLSEVLHIFESGSSADLDAWLKANPRQLDTIGLNEEEFRRKVGLMTLASLCASNSTLTFKQIADELKVAEDDVESWVIDGIRAGLVEAKIDELNSKIAVSRSTYTKFGDEQWKDLKAKLGAWRSNISSVQSTLESVLQQARV